ANRFQQPMGTGDCLVKLESKTGNEIRELLCATACDLLSCRKSAPHDSKTTYGMQCDRAGLLDQCDQFLGNVNNVFARSKTQANTLGLAHLLNPLGRDHGIALARASQCAHNCAN